LQRVLHFQADRIEQVLASHRVPSRVTGGTVTPRLVRFRVTMPLGVKVRQVAGLSEEIAMSLGASMCRIYREEGQVQVEVPRKEGQVVRLLELCRGLTKRKGSSERAVPSVTAVLGLDQEGVPLLLKLPSPNVAHVLVAGTTGSGKTALVRTMVLSLALHSNQREIQLVIVDPKGRGFAAFDGLPHLLVPTVSRIEDAKDVLKRLVSEMEKRDQEGVSDPRLVVVLDELADLVQVGGRELEALITRLTQRGREAGVHIIACTQKPTASAIGGLVKSNFPVRMVGSVASPEDAKVATGLAQTGAEKLLGQGDFLVVAKGQVTRMQAAYVTEEEVRGIVGRLRQRAGPMLLLDPPGDSGCRTHSEQPSSMAQVGERLRSQLRTSLQLVK
jgi:S-DNA-T family DNA segregation ATPase FtsK/SpoIIIE